MDSGVKMQDNSIHTHIITSHFAVPLMVAQRRGLIIEITDGHTLAYRYGTNLYYDMVKTATMRLAYDMSLELKRHYIAVVSLTPGFMRSEAMLERNGITEDNWHEKIKDDEPGTWGFADSESPYYTGRAVVALAIDDNIMTQTGHALSSGSLARKYNFQDIDGSQPPGYHQKDNIASGYFEAFGFSIKYLSHSSNPKTTN